MTASDFVGEASIAGEKVDPAPDGYRDGTLGPPVPRTCGRCRREFPGRGALDPSAAAAWSVCGPCRIKLFGDGSHPHMSSRWAARPTSGAALIGEGAES